MREFFQPGGQGKDMLGSQFSYRIPSDSTGRIDIVRPEGFGKKVGLAAVNTRRDMEPLRLISIYVHSPK
jgi:hypothetical protein